MGIFKLFAPKQTIEPPKDIQTIEVRDVKAYLVEEFQKVRQLQNELSAARANIRFYEELQIKHDASLVLLNEFNLRINEKDETIRKLNDTICQYHAKNKTILDDLNTQKILVNRLSSPREALVQELKTAILSSIHREASAEMQRLSKEISHMSGHLSKSAVLNLLKTFELKGEPQQCTSENNPESN